MAQTIVKHFDVTIPAGTPKTKPLVVPTTFNARIVDSIRWEFPAGCNGQVGIQIGSRNLPILPLAVGEYFVHSGGASGYDVRDMPDGGDWSVIGYNTGVFPHTIRVDFRLSVLPPKTPEARYIYGATVVFGEGES